MARHAAPRNRSWRRPVVLAGLTVGAFTAGSAPAWAGTYEPPTSSTATSSTATTCASAEAGAGSSATTAVCAPVTIDAGDALDLTDGLDLGSVVGDALATG